MRYTMRDEKMLFLSSFRMRYWQILTDYLHAYTLVPCNGRRSDRGNHGGYIYKEGARLCRSSLESVR